MVPAIAGLIYGPLVHRFAPEARGHGVPEVMYAVAMRGGRIAPKVALVKSFASALCIGGGGSVGREGPIVQIGSSVGSALAQWLRLDTPRVRLLVACGAAGGISATFNAPLAGPFFAMELILRDFAAQSFGAVVLSSVTASIVGRAVLGEDSFLSLPAFSVHNPVEYLLYAVLGVIVGIVGVAFTKVLYVVEDVCDWVWRGPEWARPAVGGLALGALLLALPEMYGVGYPVLQNAIQGRYVIVFLVLLMLAKMLATSLTIGIGGSGGVFAPTLFVGAMAGSAFGAVVHQWWPSATEAAGAYGLVGMGAALARGHSGVDHRGDHAFRTHRSIHDHPAADGRGRPGGWHQPPAEQADYLHPEVVETRRRHRARPRAWRHGDGCRHRVRTGGASEGGHAALCRGGSVGSGIDGHAASRQRRQ